MTPADRRAIAADLRNAAQIVADSWALPHRLYILWSPQTYGACSAIYSANAVDAFAAVYDKNRDVHWWPRNEAYRGVRVIALLLAADVIENP